MIKSRPRINELNYTTNVLTWIQFSYYRLLGHEVNFRPIDYNLLYINHCRWHYVSLLLLFTRKNTGGDVT